MMHRGTVPLFCNDPLFLKEKTLLALNGTLCYTKNETRRENEITEVEVIWFQYSVRSLQPLENAAE